MLCFASVSPQIQLLGIVGDKYRQTLINRPIRSQIGSVFIGSVNLIFRHRLIPSDYVSFELFSLEVQYKGHSLYGFKT